MVDLSFLIFGFGAGTAAIRVPAPRVGVINYGGTRGPWVQGASEVSTGFRVCREFGDSGEPGTAEACCSSNNCALFN